MRTASHALVMGLAALSVFAPAARAQVVFLQNDNFGGGAVSCHTGVGDSDSIAARFSAAAGQYPYTIDRIRVFGCGGGQDGYVVTTGVVARAGPTASTHLILDVNGYFE
jgi:hypothetical protein